MVALLKGDVFESGAQTLVNTVNCVGVMGKGVALEFKQRFPEMFQDYVERCKRGEVKLGRPYLFKRESPPWILNFPTKSHWRAVSRLDDIVKGLAYLERHYREWGIISLAVTPLGCGQGGLEWSVVGPVLRQHLSRLEIPVKLYAPFNAPDEQIQADFFARLGETAPSEAVARRTAFSPGILALVEVLARIGRQRYHWPVGRTVFQKIALFVTAAGIPTNLHFERNSYGPFSDQLKPLLTRLVNNGLLEEFTIDRMMALRPGPAFISLRERHWGEIATWDPLIERVADLFLPMRTREAEIAATALFAANELSHNPDAHPTELDVLAAVQDWKARRRPPLSDPQIAEWIRILNVQRWIHVQPSPDLPLPEETLADVS